MKVLDRYLTRELLLPIVCCAVSLVFLVLIADLFDNVDDFLTNKVPAEVMAQYYLSLAPNAFSQTIAWATWLGTVFLLVSFGLHNETLAMKAAGLKVSSIMRPVLFIGFLTGIIVFMVNDRVLPGSFKILNDIKEVYIERKLDAGINKTYHNVTYFSGGTRLYYFRKFTPSSASVRDVVVLWLDDEKGSSRQKMVAERGQWDGSKWTFENVLEYQMDSQGRIMGEPKTYVTRDYMDLEVLPRDLLLAATESSFLSYRELKANVKKLIENGVNVDSEKVELHHRLAAPWEGLVMMLIAIPILTPTRNRKAIAGSVLLCVALVFVYHVTAAVGLALGKAGKLFPFLSAWAANILFAIAALFTLDKANH